MIRIENLTKKYAADFTAVSVENLEVPQGQSFGLVGNNGAGKTTLFRMLLDLIRPTTGAVYFKDEVIAGNESWKDYTGAYLDEGFLIGHLTPDEYLLFVGEINGLNKAEIDERLDEFEDFFSGEIRGKKSYIRELSKGNQKKVGVAAALIAQPEILILDEPFANLDPSTQIRLKNLLKAYQEERQATLLISSHDLSHVTEVCERIAILEKGAVVQDIKSDESTLKELEAYFTA